MKKFRHEKTDKSVTLYVHVMNDMVTPGLHAGVLVVYIYIDHYRNAPRSCVQPLWATLCMHTRCMIITLSLACVLRADS